MNSVVRTKLGTGSVIALLFGLVVSASASPQNPATGPSENATVSTLYGATELPSGPSSSSHTVISNALPATPGFGSTSAIPPSPAMIVPVRNEAKIRAERPSLPRKTYFSLALLQHSAVAFDSWSTRNLVENGGRELNPLLRPFANSNALYPVMQTWPTAIDYIAARMARSNKSWVRKMWWVPQTASAASSFVIGARNVSLANSSVKSIK